jgi:putative transposase
MAAYLTSGQTIEMDGTQYELDRQIGNEWQIINKSTKKAIQIEVSELLEKYASGEACFANKSHVDIPKSIQSTDGSKVVAHLDMYPEDEAEEMKRKRQFLECHLKECGDIRSQRWIAISINKYWKNDWGKPPSPATVARQLKRYVDSGRNILSLARRNDKKGNYKPRYSQDVIDICQQVINDIYLSLERGSLNLTSDKAVNLVRQENRQRPKGQEMKVPSKSFIKSQIQKIDEYDRFAARFGRTAADNRFRGAIDSVVTERPLQRVEVDHTQLDIMVVDSVTGMVIGRPFLTVVIDVYSRVILGFHLSFDPPSHMVVAKALKMALLPKDLVLKKWHHIKGKWPMFGCMVTIVVDNGLEFHGISLESACLQLGIEIMYCPRKQGRKKPYVERIIGTINRQISDGMPGRTFANTMEKGDYDPAKNAAIPLETLEEMIAKWIVDIYHEEIHSTLGVPPRVEWENSISESEIRLVPDASELDAIWGVIAKRRLSHQGIEINSLRYNSIELRSLRLKYGDLKQVTIKWDPEDLSYIHLLPPDGTFLKVPIVPSQQDYATGLRLKLHTQYQKYVNDRQEDSKNIDRLIEARNELHELAMSAAKGTKIKRRALARKQAIKNTKQDYLEEEKVNAAVQPDSSHMELSDLYPSTPVPAQRRKLPAEIRNIS